MKRTLILLILLSLVSSISTKSFAMEEAGEDEEFETMEEVEAEPTEPEAEPAPEEPAPTAEPTEEPAPEEPAPTAEPTEEPAPEEPAPTAEPTEEPAPEEPAPNAEPTEEPAPEEPAEEVEEEEPELEPELEPEPTPEEPAPTAEPTEEPAPEEPVEEPVEEVEEEEEEEPELEPTEEPEPVEEEAPEPPAEKPTPIELTEEEPLQIKGDPATRKEWFALANDHYKTIKDFNSETEKIAKEMVEKRQDIDAKMDPFHNKINPLLGQLEQKSEQIKEAILEVKTIPVAWEEVQKTFQTLEENADKLRLQVQTISTIETGLNRFIDTINNAKMQATDLVVKAGKIKRKILHEEEKAKAHGHLKEIIRIEGAVSQIKAQSEQLNKQFSKEISKIEEELKQSAAQGEKLLTQVGKLANQIKEKPTIPEEPKEIEVEEEEEAPKKIKVPKIKMLWYEKIISSVAEFFIKIRDGFRALFKIDPEKKMAQLDVTSTDTAIVQLESKLKTIKQPGKRALVEKTHKKLHEIASERDKLLKQLQEKKIEVRESNWQIVKRMFGAIFKLIKRAFHAVGRFLNKIIHAGADVGKVEVEVDEAEVETTPETEEESIDTP